MRQRRDYVMSGFNNSLYSDQEFDEIVTMKIDEMLFEHEERDLTYDEGIELMLIHLLLRACEHNGRKYAALKVDMYMKHLVKNFDLPA